jgi:hypothetical protein
MISLFCIILTLGLSSCGIFSKHKEKDPSNDARISSLVKKYQTMAAEYRDVSKDQNGWPDVNDCDATLWAGEVCSAGLQVDIGQAEYPPGQINRRPSPSCYVDGQPNGSSSTVSNDMILGYLSCLWKTQDLHALQRLADYGEAHNWQMGEPATSDRVFLKPNQQGLLGRALSQLGDDRSYSNIPAVYFPVKADYEKHLQVLGILLNGQIDGSINDSMFQLLKNLADDQNDALIQATYGKYSGDESKAIGLLLDENYAPPSYVRGADNYKMVHWLKAASLIVGEVPIDE